ncbi:MAG: thiolase family protein [Burkholderiales bacterium]|nr:thiolase family protein [Burkholderiales bacterium]
MKHLRHRYCIVGVGNTVFGQTPEHSQLALNVMAIRAALDDAGLTTRDLDGVLTKAPTSTFPKLWAARVAEAMRVRPNIIGTLDQAGATNIGLIQYAISCIELGQGEVVAIAYGDNPRTGTRATYARARGGDGALAGLFGTPSGYAMAARRRMYEYGTTKEQLGHVAITHRHHASMNPNAVYRQPITMDDYLAARWVAEPFGLLDCCPVSDGGAAYIVTTEARAKALKKTPVYIRGIGQSHPSWEFYRRPDLAASGAAVSGRLCFDSAGMRPEDVDFCEIYDCFTIVPIITLEEYGFVARGKGGELYQEGETRLGGRLPCNTSGGLLSETGMPGTQLVCEAVRQLRGECGVRQVKDPTVGLVSQQGGILTTHATMLLSLEGR